ncbi:MAG: hypothetical protein CL599_16545 [Alteromonas sp.]|jgi:hypothetical protein|nr:hypothetical protein [Alteromonas sp.]OUX84472.1 MAG: hypothetical protein CBB95_16020 [Alteromonas sp. TMED35]|tara:strand:+ start:48243 stop:48446 length:204 start_codon:yes stop_codon:yes gene_type:complete
MPKCKVEELAVECIYLEKELVEKHTILSQARCYESKRNIVLDIDRLLAILISNKSAIEELTHLSTDQ